MKVVSAIIHYCINYFQLLCQDVRKAIYLSVSLLCLLSLNTSVKSVSWWLAFSSTFLFNEFSFINGHCFVPVYEKLVQGVFFLGSMDVSKITFQFFIFSLKKLKFKVFSFNAYFLIATLKNRLSGVEFQVLKERRSLIQFTYWFAKGFDLSLQCHQCARPSSCIFPSIHVSFMYLHRWIQEMYATKKEFGEWLKMIVCFFRFVSFYLDLSCFSRPYSCLNWENLGVIGCDTALLRLSLNRFERNMFQRNVNKMVWSRGIFQSLTRYPK
eukprot:TRINITY_DN44466_c1_g1_i3.p2 TRINITY_DN44466_c1_g1~~TRINITY_DN44466_c1_g1_i3.p2  ORF type:complete len:268 (-),score=-0.55 TRINITY_DN44466_c1_g1_i3:272-1075(-)